MPSTCGDVIGYIPEDFELIGYLDQDLELIAFIDC